MIGARGGEERWRILAAGVLRARRTRDQMTGTHGQRAFGCERPAGVGRRLAWLAVLALCVAVLAVTPWTTAGAASGSTGTTAAGTTTAPSTSGELAYLSDSNIYGTKGTATLATVQPDGSGRRALLSTTNASIGLVSFSPDGKQIVYFRGTSSSARVDVMTLATKAVITPLRLRGSGAYVVGLAWTPDGSDLILGANEVPGTSTTHKETALWRVPLHGGTSRRLTGYDGAGSVSVASNGTIVYVVSKTFSSQTYQPSALWTSGAGGADPRRLLTSSRFIDTPAVSPDGQTIAFSLVKNDTTSHLQTIGIGGSAVRDLTPAVKGRSDLEPSWTPAGRDIVFLSSRAGRHENSKTDQLLDAYRMTATGADVTKEIAYEGDTTSVVLVSWGP